MFGYECASVFSRVNQVIEACFLLFVNLAKWQPLFVDLENKDERFQFRDDLPPHFHLLAYDNHFH